MSAESTTIATRQEAITPVWRIWLIAAVGAMLLPLAVWLVADPIAGHRLEAVTGDTTMQIGAVDVGIGGLAGALCGLGLAMLLRRFARRARRIWLVTASVVLILSLLSPLAGTTAPTVVALMVMHLAVGAAVIPAGLALLPQATSSSS